MREPRAIPVYVFLADEATCAVWDAQEGADTGRPTNDPHRPGWYWRCDALEENEVGPFASQEECKADIADAKRAEIAQGRMLPDQFLDVLEVPPPPRGERQWH